MAKKYYNSSVTENNATDILNFLCKSENQDEYNTLIAHIAHVSSILIADKKPQTPYLNKFKNIDGFNELKIAIRKKIKEKKKEATKAGDSVPTVDATYILKLICENKDKLRTLIAQVSATLMNNEKTKDTVLKKLETIHGYSQYIRTIKKNQDEAKADDVKTQDSTRKNNARKVKAAVTIQNLKRSFTARKVKTAMEDANADARAARENEKAVLNKAIKSLQPNASDETVSKEVEARQVAAAAAKAAFDAKAAVKAKPSWAAATKASNAKREAVNAKAVVKAAAAAVAASAEAKAKAKAAAAAAAGATRATVPAAAPAPATAVNWDYPPPESWGGSGGGRRRTKNAKYYNKRRRSKRRRSKRRRSNKRRA